MEPKNETFFSWLKDALLDRFHQTLLDNGISEISHLQDVEEEDAIGFGLTKFQFRRMQRLCQAQGECHFKVRSYL